MKSKHVVFVHGLFGWGPGEMGGLPYWGYALERDAGDFTLHEAGCGPVSSFHDRACEVAAQIRGARVDYREDHSKRAGHARLSDDYSGRPFVRGWSEDNPVILVGHSAGGHTCLQLQQLLAEDFWGWGSNADWVEALVTVSAVLNGSLLPYMFGCSKETGLLTTPVGNFLGNVIQFFAMAGSGSLHRIYDFDLDQWIGEGHSGNFKSICAALSKTGFAGGEDNLAFDLTLQGCLKANAIARTNPSSYYLSIVTEQTTKGRFTSGHYPDLSMNPILAASAAYQGFVVDFDVPPIPGWGSGDLDIARWRSNDGAVSSISQRYPFTAGSHPVGGEGIFRRKSIEKGKWYFERAEKITGRTFDHLDVCVGCLSDPSMVDAHKRLYDAIYLLLGRLP